MIWLTPIAGAILAAAIIPPLILLYFLKLRRRPQPIASTLLWKKSIEDLRANAPFQRLRRNLLLLLQLIAILLLVLSVMQPQIEGGGRDGGRTILMIDNSASMNAIDTEDGGTRLDEAKRRAKERIEALYGGGILGGSGGETMIVAFSDRAEVACRFSRSKNELLTAIDRIRPTDGRTMIDEAFKLARAYTTNVDPENDRPLSDPATFEIFTDGRIRDLDDEAIRSGETVVYQRVGTGEPRNVGIVAVDVERPYDRPSAVEVFAALVNYEPAPVTCDVQLTMNDAALAVQTLELPAAEVDPVTGSLLAGRNNVVFTPFDQPRGAVIEVAVLRPDDFPVDDTARRVVPPPKQLRVALVPPTSVFVKQMLEGMALERLQMLTPAAYEARATEGRLDEFDLIVFDGYAPPEGLMPPARYLVFGPAPPIEGLNPYGEETAQIVLNVRDEHPVLRYASLDKLIVPACNLLQPADDVEVLAEGSEGPLVVSVSRGLMHVVYVPFDPARSNWPLLRSWVTFNFNAVEYLGHIGDRIAESGVDVGEAISTRLPANADDISILRPDGTSEPVDVADPSLFSWGPVRLAGLYVLTWSVPGVDDPDSRPFAVNLLDEDEGRIAVVEELVLGSESLEGVGADESSYTPLWPWAVGFCLAVLMLEWWVYHRKTFV